MKNLTLGLLLIISLLVAACSDTAPDDKQSGQALEAYTCSMHPHYITTDADGSCPICGMDLVPVSGNAKTLGDGLNKVSEQDTITVSDSMIQTMGVRTSAAEIIEFGQTLRAFGTVEADERLENVSVSRLEGWIDDLSVRAEGDAVTNGDLLYRIYSPDLISAQRDYLSAVTTGNLTRIESVKQRLLSIGMQEQPLRQLSQRKTVIMNVPVYAETDGIVAELHVRNGDYVKPGSPVLGLQSYNKVWVIASIPETDLPLINRGISASLRFPSAPNAPSNGNVDYIYPTIDPKTRTAKVRIELDNASGDLQPGAYADITLGFDKQTRLSIVSEAILRDSRGNHVILALGAGRFRSASVTTGISADGHTEILSGLNAGDLVVASGQFMLDSEVNLREGLSKLSRPPVQAIELIQPLENKLILPNADFNTSLSELELDATRLAQIDHLVDMALYFHLALIDGETIDPRFVDPAILLIDLLVQRYNNTDLIIILEQSKNALLNAKTSSKGQALAADLAALMQAIKPWILEGVPQHYSDLGLTLYRDLGSEKLWLQKNGDPVNPYGNAASAVFAWPVLTSGQAEPIVDPHSSHR